MHPRRLYQMKVYVTRKIPQEAITLLDPHFDISIWPEENTAVPRDVLLKEMENAQGLLCLLTEKIDRELLEVGKNLKIIANMAVGYDNIDVAACTQKRVIVTNTPGVLTDATADLAFALLMATARRIPEAQDYLERGMWKTWSPMLLTGQEVWGTTIGIVGMGRIGMAVARRAKGFNMGILYSSPRRNLGAEKELKAERRSLSDLLRESDFVSIHVPLTYQTQGLIGENELNLMKPTAVLINTARGQVVDENALVEALRLRKIWAAGLDVFQQEPLSPENPLLELDNVVLLPHIGSATIKTRTQMAVIAARNIERYLLTGKPVTPVNPEACDK
jgi:glyoxylate reductase